MEELNIAKVYLRAAACSVQLTHPTIGDLPCTVDGTGTTSTPLPAVLYTT